MEKICSNCVFDSAARSSTVCKTCVTVAGELGNWKSKLVPPTFDEERIDTIGQNGNEGLHYDNVSKPKHYQLLPGVEVMDVRRALLAKIDAMDSPPSAFAVNCWDRGLEYTIRAWEKNGMEDLEKAVTYLQLCIEELKSEALPTTQSRSG